jgi:putative transposase
MTRESSELKRFAHSVGQNWYHIVMIPRGRYPVFAQEHQRCLLIKAIEWVCSRHSIDVYAKEIMDDHVHLFISCPPDYSIWKLVQIVKGGTSYYIRSHHPSLRQYKGLWSKGFMYRSVGNVSAKIVKRYIEFSNKWVNSRQKKLI